MAMNPHSESIFGPRAAAPSPVLLTSPWAGISVRGEWFEGRPYQEPTALSRDDPSIFESTGRIPSTA